MPSRKKRKRYRRMAEATASTPKSCGGWGCGAPTTLQDLVWLRRAVNQDWPVSEAVRSAIVRELMADFENKPPRESLSICRTVIAMGLANLRTFEDAIHAFGA